MSELRTLVDREMDRAGSPSYSFADLTRRRDSKQRNRRIGTAVLALVFAAAAIGGVVRAFRVGENSRPADLPSTPEAWTRVPFPTSPSDEIMAVTAGGPGLVAVGVSGSEQVFWTSSDGRTWNRVPGPLRNGSILDITAGGPGLVGVGRAWGHNAPVWTSTDGTTWDVAPPDPVFRGAWLRAVVAGGPGLVTVGSTMDGPAAWYSTDGVAWNRASAPPLPSGVAHDGRWADAWIQDVAVAGDRLVAIGQIGLVAGGVRYDPLVWTSTDGVAWTVVDIAEDVFPRSTLLRSIAGSPGGFVVVGGPDGHYASLRIWTSADGLAWSGLSPDQDAFVSQAVRQPDKNDDLHLDMRSVAFGSGGFVAVGQDDWCTYGPPGFCWPAEVAVWTSADGETWLRVRSDPVFQFEKTRGIHDPVVVAWGSRFVVAATHGEEGVAVWISEPSGE